MQVEDATLCCEVCVKQATPALNYRISLAEKYSTLERVILDKGWVLYDRLRILSLNVHNATAAVAVVLLEVGVSDCKLRVLRHVNEPVDLALVSIEWAPDELNSLDQTHVLCDGGNHLHEIAVVILEERVLNAHQLKVVLELKHGSLGESVSLKSAVIEVHKQIAATYVLCCEEIEFLGEVQILHSQVHKSDYDQSKLWRGYILLRYTRNLCRWVNVDLKSNRL